MTASLIIDRTSKNKNNMDTNVKKKMRNTLIGKMWKKTAAHMEGRLPINACILDMTSNRFILTLVTMLLGLQASAQTTTITSPDKRISMVVEHGKHLSYHVLFDGDTLVGKSPMGFELVGEKTMKDSLFLIGEQSKDGQERWFPVVKNKHDVVDARWNGSLLQLQEAGGDRRKMNLEVKVFDDGVAFRYHLYDDHRLTTRLISRELTGFCLPASASAWVADYQSHVTSQEKEFVKTPIRDINAKVVAGLPLLVEVAQQRWLAITEADINNYPGFFIGVHDGLPQTMLSPQPGDDLVKARFDDEITSPWRVILISDNPGKMIESEMIRTLNPPCAISDTSWIKPGLSAWDHWWSGEVKMEMPVIKEYIDLAAEEGWPYMLVDWQWYGPFNEPSADITKPAPQIDIQEILRYAKDRNVRIWLWLYSSDVNRNDAYKKAFPLYEKWGVAGIKIDFMDRQDQYMVNWYRRIIEEAAKHHLTVDFHGAYKPDGIERTWPNMMTREGVMGNEYNKWDNGLSPEHNVKLAFTRMLAGPMDYTPGGFLNVSRKDHKPQQPALVGNSRCAELAKFVIYESPYTVVCDHPKHILGQPGADFLKSVPTEWDDTRFLQGSPDSYIAMARRNGDKWFIGVMNNSMPRTVIIDTSFLGKGEYTLTYWSDGKKASDVIRKTIKVQAGKTLKIKMAAAGGYVAEIKP